MSSRSELAKQAEQTLKDEINHLEDIHERETTLWKDSKLQYEVRAQRQVAKINHLKTFIDELRAKTEMDGERIRTLFHSHRDSFVQQKEAFDRGWACWTKQARETSYIPFESREPPEGRKGFL